jgi:hypothetical protein
MNNSSNNNEDFIVNEDFNNAVIAYLDEVNRKKKKDENYLPHPIMRAISIAIEEQEQDGTFMAVSSNDETETEPIEIYSAVVKKSGNDYYILNITDLSTGKEILISEALLLIELSLKLDKFEGNFVPSEHLSYIFNGVIKNVIVGFVTPSNYKEARNTFRGMLEKGKIHFPPNPSLIDSFCKITEDTRWENYDPEVRQIIAACWAMENNKTVGFSFDSDEIPKKTIISCFKQIGAVPKLLNWNSES